MMDQYEPATYGERIAEVYDDIHPSISETDAMVETLAKLAGAGPVLELGIGTDRVALPLAAHGVKVHGIDASQAMVKKLRAKPGGASIPVVIGDFSDVDVTGQYSLSTWCSTRSLRLPHKMIKCAVLLAALRTCMRGAHY